MIKQPAGDDGFFSQIPIISFPLIKIIGHSSGTDKTVWWPAGTRSSGTLPREHKKSAENQHHVFLHHG
jgi:hypothetical protein